MINIKRYLPSAVAVLAGLAGSTLYAGTYTVPQGCTPILTTHSALCEVTINWTCDTGSKGSATFDSDGVQSIYEFNSQNALTDARYMWDDSHEVMEDDPEDPYSLAMLMLKGTDSYAMQITRTDPTGTRALSLIGTDWLTGETLTIGDHTLVEIQSELDYIEADGALNYHSEGTQYLLQSEMILLGGSGQAMDPDGRWDFDQTPVELIFLGQPGFAETTPLYGCAASEVEPQPAPQPQPQPTPAPAPAPTGPLNTGSGANNDK